VRYSRDIPVNSPPDVVVATEEHVRAHLSSVATADDDPDTMADTVTVQYIRTGDTIRITGTLLAPPVAPYLRDGFNPKRDDPSLSAS
jgi:hypothetical protein